MKNGLTKILPGDKALSYMGRIRYGKEGVPEFFFAGSSVTLRFTGTAAKAVIRNHRIYNIQELGAVIDGKQTKIRFESNDEPIELDITDGLEQGEHEVILFKRQDGSHWFEFLGFLIDGEALPPKPKPKRTMECYGDSVSAGAVTEAIENTGMCDPDDTQGIYDNAWYSYSMITARNLGAQLHNVAQGGIAIFDDTGYFHSPDCIGMETVYNKTAYFPEACYSDWDFSSYKPDVVLFAVGQNDQHNEGGRPDNDIYDSAFRERWKKRYKEIICDLAEKYPNAVFILLLTVLCHDPEWDRAVEEIKCELEGSCRVHHFCFKRTGKATPGHPRIPEQYEMAEELTAFISSLGDEIWQGDQQPQGASGQS